MIPSGRFAGRAKRLRGNTDGGVAVEFALVLPLLLFIIAGLAQTGVAFAVYSEMGHAVRQGVRYAALSGEVDGQSTYRCDGPTPAARDAGRITCQALAAWTARDLVFEITTRGGGSAPDGPKHVTVTATVTDTSSIDVLALGFALENTATMVVASGGASDGVAEDLGDTSPADEDDDDDYDDDDDEDDDEDDDDDDDDD